MRVVGFDLDDTLVAEALFLKSGAFHMARWLHARHHEVPADRMKNAMLSAISRHQNHYAALEGIIGEFGLSDAVDMKEVVAEFRNHMPDPDIYHMAPSMLETLMRLKADPETRLVLITDGRSRTQRNKLQAARLHDFFDDSDIYISEEIGHDKTSPDTFLHIMEKYAGANEYHYVGDNPPKDFLHPSRLGWTTHRVHPFPLMIHPQGMPR